MVRGDGQQKGVAAPVQRGMGLNAHPPAANAYRAGRSGGIPSILQTQFRTYRSGVDVAPVMVLDERGVMIEQLLLNMNGVYGPGSDHYHDPPYLERFQERQSGF